MRSQVWYVREIVYYKCYNGVGVRVVSWLNCATQDFFKYGFVFSSD